MEPRRLPEMGFYTDDPRFIAELIKKEWTLDTLDMPLSIAYESEQFMTSARIGHVYVYETSHSAQVSTTDYRTLDRESHVSIRISNRFRDVHYAWVNEIYRILMGYRRAGAEKLNGYTHMEMFVDKVTNDASGWYVTTMEIRLIAPCMPILSPGFGDETNRKIYDKSRHTVTIIAGEGGSVTSSLMSEVPDDAVFAVSGNTLTVWHSGMDYGLTEAVAESGHTFVSWSVSSGDKVTGDMTVTADFT